MNWYIGQDIVAVRDHSQGRFKRGDEFKIRGLKVATCGCGYILIDVGIIDNSITHNICIRCGRVEKRTRDLFYNEICFAPLDPIKEAISELMEQSVSKVTEI